MWMIRAGSGSKNIEEFVEHRVAAMGDTKLRSLPSTITKEELVKLYAEHYPDIAEATRATWASQLLRFVSEVKNGDDVVTYDREHRKYLLGKITSEYQSRTSTPRRGRWCHCADSTGHWRRSRARGSGVLPPGAPME